MTAISFMLSDENKKGVMWEENVVNLRMLLLILSSSWWESKLAGLNARV